MNSGTLGAGLTVSDSGQALLNGGQVDANVYGNGSGSIDVEGATVTGDIFMNDSSSLIANSGNLVDLEADGNSTVQLGGAQFSGSAAINDNAHFTMSGNTEIKGSVSIGDDAVATLGVGKIDGNLMFNGDPAATLQTVIIAGSMSLSDGAVVTTTHDTTVLKDLAVHDDTELTLEGEVEGNLLVDGDGDCKLVGGQIDGSATALLSGTIEVRDGGVIGGPLNVDNNGSLQMTGGQISGLVTLQDNSVSTWDGGQIDNKIQLFGNAKLYWNGALLTSESTSNSVMDAAGLLPADSDDDSSPLSIYLYDNSSLTIGGQDLSAELLDGNSEGGFSEYSLSGILGDGVSLPSNLQLYVENGATANFTFVLDVPEPMSAGTMLMAGWGILARRRRSSRGSDPI
jgi:hypothetical protein